MVNNSPIHTRVADPDDALAIETIRAAGWQRAYQGIIDSEMLDTVCPDPARRLARLSDPEAIDYVAQIGDKSRVAGWVSFGHGRDTNLPTGSWEIYACYVAPNQWGLGIGSALLSAALRAIGEGPAVALWVLEKNTPARRFYERFAFVPDGEKQLLDRDYIPATPVTEVRYLRPAGTPLP